jgi:hypothetical protein
MGKKINKIAGIIAAISLIVVVLIGFYKKHQFMEKYEFTSGKIIKVTITGWKSSGDYSVMYEYNVNNMPYLNDQNYNYCGYLNMVTVKSLLEGKEFPVAYSVNSPRTCMMLITLRNAERFHYTFPDSLKKYDSILTCK